MRQIATNYNQYIGKSLSTVLAQAWRPPIMSNTSTLGNNFLTSITPSWLSLPLLRQHAWCLVEYCGILEPANHVYRSAFSFPLKESSIFFSPFLKSCQWQVDRALDGTYFYLHLRPDINQQVWQITFHLLAISCKINFLWGFCQLPLPTALRWLVDPVAARPLSRPCQLHWTHRTARSQSTWKPINRRSRKCIPTNYIGTGSTSHYTLYTSTEVSVTPLYQTWASSRLPRNLTSLPLPSRPSKRKRLPE